MKKLSKVQILMLHAQLIQQTGGSDGVRDYNLLDSALYEKVLNSALNFTPSFHIIYIS